MPSKRPVRSDEAVHAMHAGSKRVALQQLRQSEDMTKCARKIFMTESA